MDTANTRKPRKTATFILVHPDRTWSPATGERTRVPSWLPASQIDHWVAQGCPGVESSYKAPPANLSQPTATAPAAESKPAAPARGRTTAAA